MDVFEHIVDKICLERGWVTTEQIIQCLIGSTSFGTPGVSHLLISDGLVDKDRIEALRKEAEPLLQCGTGAEQDDKVLAETLVREHLVSRQQVAEALSIQKSAGEAPPRLGVILIERGHVTFAAVIKAMGARKDRTYLQCAACGARFWTLRFDGKKKYPCKKCKAPLVSRKALPDRMPEDARHAARDPRNRRGKYVIVMQVGAGGMGVVYKAWDSQLHRYVALKTLVGSIGEYELSRFRMEARTAAALRHPNIVGIYDIIGDSQRPMIAMEFVDGAILSKKKLSAVEAARVISEIAQAVHHAHTQGIVHRDIKPQNIMMDREGKPYIMDFGLATYLREVSLSGTAETILGTPMYMSPEQAEGHTHLIDARSDIYALGAVLYELLTGRPPFNNGGAFETLRSVIQDPVVPPSQLQPSVPPALEAIVLKCLEKEKTLRYQSALKLAQDLRGFISTQKVRRSQRLRRRFGR